MRLARFPGLSLAVPRGGFYAFASVRVSPNSAAFALDLLRKTGVAGPAPGLGIRYVGRRPHSSLLRRERGCSPRCTGSVQVLSVILRSEATKDLGRGGGCPMAEVLRCAQDDSLCVVILRSEATKDLGRGGGCPIAEVLRCAQDDSLYVVILRSEATKDLGRGGGCPMAEVLRCAQDDSLCVVILRSEATKDLGRGSRCPMAEVLRCAQDDNHEE